MAKAALTFLMDQLKEVTVWYKDNIAEEAENEFNQLNKDLCSLRDFLKETEKKVNEDYMLLERRIKEVVYEVEDTIDTCLTISMEAKAKSSLRRRLGSSSRTSLAESVKSIREEKLRPLIDVANKQNISDGSGGIEDPPTKSIMDAPIRKNNIVGFEDEEATITGYLMEKRNELDVISIVGIPGQGKTTLTWKIYQNNDIDFHFPIRIWVNITQEFSSRDVFLQILRKFTPSQDTSKLNDDELAQAVRICLEKERFLLVVDDVWSIDVWEEIKKVLPLANGNGKILITSREMDVGKHASVDRKPHQLRFLTNIESWALLLYEVFGNLENWPLELKGIAIKCGGMPLTIAIIGGILSVRRTRSPSVVVSEWHMVAENVDDFLRSHDPHKITDVVALSYDRLPFDLRDCFVYMGVFPQYYEIPIKMLFGLWISEGFIQPMDERSLEETAEENLNYLIQRNLVKVERTNHMGKVKTCRVLNMIRAYCITKSKEQNLFQEIKILKTTRALEPPVSELHKFRRLCFQSDLSKFFSENPNGPYARSFLCFYGQPVVLSPKYVSAIPDGFPKLRILEAKAINFGQFPAMVTKLIHLRYLTLFIDNINSLPASMSRLWNLQTLVVETKTRSIEMKANMWRMIQLRHLKTRAAIVLDSDWQGEAGHNLETLNRLSPESFTEVVSKKTKNLKTLGISGKLADMLGTKFLENLDRLEKLKLENSLTDEPTSEDMPFTLPQPNCFPPHLKRLTLTSTFIQWKHMSTLAKIGTLEVLKLKDNAFIGTYWSAADDCFPRLQVLLISNVDLVIWEASTESFPSLRCLVLKNCENLIEIPEAFVKTLEKMEIDRVPESAVVSARKFVELKTRAQEHGKAKSGLPFDLSIGPNYRVLKKPI